MEQGNIFNDSHGRSFIKLLGVLCLAKIALEYHDLEGKQKEATMSKDQFLNRYDYKDTLLKRKAKSLFLNNNDFHDTEKYKEYLDLNKARISDRLDQINDIVSALIESTSNTEEALLSIGEELWNKELDKRQELKGVMKAVIKSLSK